MGYYARIQAKMSEAGVACPFPVLPKRAQERSLRGLKAEARRRAIALGLPDADRFAASYVARSREWLYRPAGSPER